MSLLVLDNVSFKRGERSIFTHIDYGFEEGSLSLLRGDSGSGKSTLLRIMAGFAPLEYEGDVLINGKAQGTRSIAEKAGLIGMVFQNPNQQFTMRTLRREITFALENIGLGYEAVQERLIRAVDVLQSNHLLDRDLVTLSGGEKQRASLTVLLAMDAPVFLLDEPFASIDPRSRHELIDLLGDLRNMGKTIIVCDHDLTHYDGIVDQVVTLTPTALVPEEMSLLRQESTPVLWKTQASKQSFIDFSQVGYKRGKRVLLDPIDWSFNKGITTLTGDNGTGKSTLLKTVVQQQKYQGKMFLNGQRMKKGKKLYRDLTLAVQDASKQFVTLTPKEELNYNCLLTEEQQKKQHDVLGKLGLLDKLEGSLFHLSEGQKKMMQLTTMMSLDCQVLLLDEPFTGLDERASALFMDWIEEKSKEQDFIIVSHRLAPLSGRSDHHVELKNKQLVLEGYNQVKEALANECCTNQYA